MTRLICYLLIIVLELTLAACQPEGTVLPWYRDHTLEARPGEWERWGDSGRL